MQYLVTITGHLSRPIDVSEGDATRQVSQVHNRFLFNITNLSDLYLATADKIRLIMQQGGMFGKKDPSDVMANNDVDIRTRFFAPIISIQYLDFDSKQLSSPSIQEDEDGIKEIVQ
jgi:hypothetical protein